jgi:hypothetical protein
MKPVSTPDQPVPDALRQIRSSRPMSGRYYLEKWYRIEEQQNFLPPCETKLVTPELIRFSTPFPAVLDDRAFVYVESLGLMRGTISRAMGPTSEMDIEMSLNERSRLASRIIWADMQAGFKGVDLRRFPRFEPANPNSAFTLPDGTTLQCTIANISLTGAAVVSDLRPALNSSILLGQIHSEIRRHMDFGFSVEFCTIQDPARLEVLATPPPGPIFSDLLILRSEDARSSETHDIP